MLFRSVSKKLSTKDAVVRQKRHSARFVWDKKYPTITHALTVYSNYTKEWNIIMNVTLVDLRYKMNDVLKVLERNEVVTVKYRGKLKGTIVPNRPDKHKAVREHHFFGMNKDHNESVDNGFWTYGCSDLGAAG